MVPKYFENFYMMNHQIYKNLNGDYIIMEYPGETYEFAIPFIIDGTDYPFSEEKEIMCAWNGYLIRKDGKYSLLGDSEGTVTEEDLKHGYTMEDNIEIKLKKVITVNEDTGLVKAVITANGKEMEITTDYCCGLCG